MEYSCSRISIWSQSNDQFAFLVGIVIPFTVFAAEQSPYAGEELILAEMRLDQAFEEASIDRQKQLLSPDQRQNYDTLRGYKGANHGHHGHSNTSKH